MYACKMYEKYVIDGFRYKYILDMGDIIKIENMNLP